MNYKKVITLQKIITIEERVSYYQSWPKYVDPSEMPL